MKPFKSLLETQEQTKTPAFKKWFGKSKAVDKSGKPLVVFHGTNKKFTEFNDMHFKNGWLGKGVYFTTDKKFAKDNGRTVIQAYLKIQNLFKVKGDAPNDVLSEIKSKYPEADEFNLAKILKQKGYDGIYFNHWDKGEMYSVFSPNQIKSATGNNGNFNSRSNNILE